MNVCECKAFDEMSKWTKMHLKCSMKVHHDPNVCNAWINNANILNLIYDYIMLLTYKWNTTQVLETNESPEMQKSQVWEIPERCSYANVQGIVQTWVLLH